MCAGRLALDLLFVLQRDALVEQVAAVSLCPTAYTQGKIL